jgi:Predicted acyltransferase
MSTLTLLNEADVGELLTLQRAAFALDVCVRYPGYTAPVTQSLEELRDEIKNDQCIAIGLKENGRLIGSIRIRRIDTSTIFLARLCIAPDRFGEGLAKKLMHSVDKYVAQYFPEAKRIEMTADGTNTWLVNWYGSLGYEPFERGTKTSPNEWRLARELS